MNLGVPLLAAAFAATIASDALAAERTSSTLPAARTSRLQPPAPRPAACQSPDGPQPEGTIRCEVCPTAPGSRVMYRPMQCTGGKWVEAGPCADGDCAGRTY